ncbi:hypothetical protein AMECASPLE_037833, partial [Ameca splendens]
LPFLQVFATDQDDPETENAHLRYSLISQIPNNRNILMFQIDPETGEISTTEEGQEMLKARAGIQYARGEDWSSDSLKAKFTEYCMAQDIPYEENPFFTCVERQGLFLEIRDAQVRWPQIGISQFFLDCFRLVMGK